MELTLLQVETLHKWYQAKSELRRWGEIESHLRDQIVKELFDTNRDEGTESLTVFNDWTLKATKKLNYILNNDEGQISAICASLPEQLSKQLVRWKPELSLTTYRTLDVNIRQMFNGTLSIKPAKPTLELFAPTNSTKVLQ